MKMTEISTVINHLYEKSRSLREPQRTGFNLF